ncbi:MAG TPA: hypothetical protein VF641_00005 [Methylobacterium sp.]
MLRKFVLAALLVLGFAAAMPQGASAAPIGPALALQSEAAPGIAEQAQYYRRRGYGRGYGGYGRGYGRRGFYGRPYYGGRGYYRPRPFYRPYGPRRFFF